jgi:glutamate/aspartate transport system substrate-binding protein
MAMRKSSSRRCLLAALLAALLLPAAHTSAQPNDEPAARALTGVLKRIKEARVVRIGVRGDAVPFSFFSTGGHAQGYSVELCQALVEDIAEAIGVAGLDIVYRRVTPADRLDRVEDGRIDLECGSTTNTAERRRRVAFSPLIFVAGTRLLVGRGSPIRSARDLGGRTVAVVRGTTNEAAMREYAAGKNITVRTFEDYETALAQLAAGAVAAVAADDVLLAGWRAHADRRQRFAIVGGLLSYEPYGIAFARDDAPLADAIHAGFRRLAASGELRSIYAKWFLRPLPSGQRLAWPMSPELERAFELLGMPPE